MLLPSRPVSVYLKRKTETMTISTDCSAEIKQAKNKEAPFKAAFAQQREHARNLLTHAPQLGRQKGQQPNCTEQGALPPIDSKVSVKGMLLRTKALALLQEAQAVDGLKPFTVTHTHSFGESTYVLWAAEKPTQEQAEAVLDSEFEPDHEETLAVEDCFSLEEMSGVAVTARLPDLLESLQSPDQDDSPSP